MLSTTTTSPWESRNGLPVQRAETNSMRAPCSASFLCHPAVVQVATSELLG